MKIYTLFFMLFLVVSVNISCEEAPEGIQTTLFDETGVPDPELNLFMDFTIDINNIIDDNKNQNFQINWGERIFFDVAIQNLLEDVVEEVSLRFTGVSNSSLTRQYNTDLLQFGDIDVFQSRTPDTYWCFFCNESNEIYLGRTWVETSTTGFTTENITINMVISFRYNNAFYQQDVTHTFTVFP